MITNICPECKTRTLLTLARTVVCTDCGLEKIVPYDIYATNEQGHWNSFYFQTAYSRKKRFGKLFDSVIFGGSDTKDEKMLAYLTGVRDNIKNFENLLECIKTCTLADKRYGSLHLLSRIFLKNYKPPARPKNIFELRKRVLRQFESLEIAHRKKYDKKPFFNYRWLLGKILTECGVCQYTRYIKEIKCKNRNKHYEDMFSELSTTV